MCTVDRVSGTAVRADVPRAASGAAIPHSDPVCVCSNTIYGILQSSRCALQQRAEQLEHQLVRQPRERGTVRVAEQQ